MRLADAASIQWRLKRGGGRNDLDVSIVRKCALAGQSLPVQNAGIYRGWGWTTGLRLGVWTRRRRDRQACLTDRRPSVGRRSELGRSKRTGEGTGVAKTRVTRQDENRTEQDRTRRGEDKKGEGAVGARLEQEVKVKQKKTR